MTDRTNEEWLAALRDDGTEQAAAVEDLRDRLKRSIFYYLSRERSDLQDLSIQEIDQMAQDLAQDATLRVIDNLDTFRGDSRFTTWATKIAVRIAISDLRRAHYKDFSLDDMTADGDWLHTAAKTDNQPPNPEDAAERSDVMLKIGAALREALTERQYQALEAVALRGVPLEIVAEQMDTNRNALYKLIHDARRKLKRHLDAQGLSIDYMMDLFQD